MTETPLSTRETEILALVAEGKSNKEIAADLFISINTVKVHVSKIFQKIGVSSRTEATLYAIEKGIVDSPGTSLPDSTDPDGVQDTILLTQSQKVSPVYWVPIAILVLVLLVFLGQAAGFYTLFNNNTPTNSLISSNRIEQLPELIEPRIGAPSIAIGKNLYLFSGLLPDGISATSEKLDLVNKSWEEIAAKPSPVSNASAVSLRGGIYVPGGLNEDGLVTDIFEVYDPDRDSWSQKARLPIALSDYAITVYEGQLFLFGGWDGENHTNSTYRYDPSLDRWFEEQPMETARSQASAGILSGEICVVGGKNAKGLQASMECFDPDTNGTSKAWQIRLEKFPFPLESTLFGTALDNLFAIKPSGIWQYSRETNAWVSLSFKEPMEIPADVNTTISPDGYIYLFGGSSEDTQIENRLIRIKLIYTLSIPNVIN